MKTKPKLTRAYLLLKSKPDLNTEALLNVLKSSPYKVLHAYRNLVLIESSEADLKQLKEQLESPSNDGPDWHVFLNQYVTTILSQNRGPL